MTNDFEVTPNLSRVMRQKSLKRKTVTAMTAQNTPRFSNFRKKDFVSSVHELNLPQGKTRIINSSFDQ